MPPRNTPEISRLDFGGLDVGGWRGSGRLLRLIKGLRKTEIRSKKVAIFGPGDSLYQNFCRAVEQIEQQLRNAGAVVVLESLKLDEGLDYPTLKVREWGRRLLLMLRSHAREISEAPDKKA